jgi:DNA repair protein RadC
MILSHNHPSGNLKPSDADINLTEKIKKAAVYMDIQVLDHIIITSNGYLSFADQGLI